jgi:hypothetical protein
MAWRASLSNCRNTVRLHFIQRAGVRLPASVGLGAAAGLRPIRPKRVRTRVGTPRKHACRRLEGNINSLHANVMTSATTRGTSSGLNAMPTSTSEATPIFPSGERVVDLSRVRAIKIDAKSLGFWGSS